MDMGLLDLYGWFITATALAGLNPTTSILFDVFMPSAGIRLLALGRTLSRYGERLVTHDATLAVLADLREQLFRGWARPAAALQWLLRPARLLFRLTADMDALESMYLRLLVPLAAALGAALLARFQALGWLRRDAASRVVRFTPPGEQALTAWLRSAEDWGARLSPSTQTETSTA